MRRISVRMENHGKIIQFDESTLTGAELAVERPAGENMFEVRITGRIRPDHFAQACTTAEQAPVEPLRLDVPDWNSAIAADQQVRTAVTALIGVVNAQGALIAELIRMVGR